MDISLLTQSETAQCIIFDPVTGKDTDIVITLYSKFSDQYKEAQSAAVKDSNSNLKAEHYLATLTKSWVNVDVDGKSLDFSNENAVVVYKTSALIRDQVDRFIWEVKNFLPER